MGPDEVCELGQQEDSVSAVCGEPGNQMGGSIDRLCNVTCSAFVDDPNAVCVTEVCGNGVVEAGEQCDDGSLNGSYGFCGNDCTNKATFYCGEGTLAAGEDCD